MELPIVVAVVGLLTSCILAVEVNNVVSAQHTQASMNMQRRETTSHDMFQSIQKRLNQHTEALEKIMTAVQHNEELTRSIIAHFNDKIEEPETHGRIQVYHANRRSTNNNEDIPIVKIGKDIVRYGNLLKTVLMSDITKGLESDTVVEGNKMD